MDELRQAEATKQKSSECPVCGRPADTVLRPFCSKRCADVDLHRWLSGGYRIPVQDEPDDPESEEPSFTPGG